MLEFFFIFNTKCYAGYSFSETTYDIDNISIDNAIVKLPLISTVVLKQLLGFNFISVPYIFILLYLIIQIILIKKHSQNTLSKKLMLCVKINIIVILLICLLNTCITNCILNISEDIEILLPIKQAVEILINTLILIFGIISTNKLLKSNMEENNNRKNKKILIITILLIIILLGVHFIIKSPPYIHVVEEDWSFGITIDVRKYDLKIYKEKNIGDTDFLVKEIDSEGVLIEYERGYYEKQPASNDSDTIKWSPLDNYDYKTEIVQQKMKWNVNYSYTPAKDPLLEIDGGTDYYVRFEK